MRKATIFSVLAVGALFLLAPSGAFAQEGQTVTEIEFRGNQQFDDSTLRYKIRTKQGQRFSEAKLAGDVSTLLAFFERVSTEVQPVSGGVRVVFLVEENPLVTSVVFRGLNAIKEEDALKEGEIFTRRGFPYAKFKVQRDRTRLAEMLKEKGHYFAEVNASVGEFGGGQQVLFTVVEGPEVTVEEVRFVGNTTFTKDDLEDQMLTRESSFLASRTFVEPTLTRDIISLATFYRSEGFLDAVVELRDLSFSQDKEEVTITIGVTEGEPYNISSVEIQGGTGFPEDPGTLDEFLLVKAGDRRRDRDLLLTRQNIRNFYLENAYYDVQIALEAEDDAVSRASTIRFVVTEGAPATIRRIDIVGNTVTREDVIRRNLSVFPGGPLNSLQIQKSEDRLDGAGYFEKGSINTRIVDTDEPAVKDVVFSLSEGTTGSIRFSAGITSDFGVLGQIQLTKNNFDYADTPERFSDIIGGRAFTGGGQRLDLLLAPGTDYSRFRLAWQEPWFLDEYIFYGPSDEVEESPFSFGFDLFHTIFSRFRYDERRSGFSVSTGKSWRKRARDIDDVFSTRLSFTLENVRLGDIDDDAAPNAFLYEGLNRQHKFGFELGWSHVDRPASPGEGWQLSMTYNLAGGPLGGEVDFHKFEFRTTNYFTLGKTSTGQRHILSFHGRAGYATDFDDSDEVPPFERFLLGGSSTVRGFEFGEVGPRAEGDPFTEAGRARIRRSLAKGRGDPLGGQGMWLARLEYGFPIYEDVLRGVVFSDSGNVTETWDSDIFSNFRSSVGFGVRVRLPFFGPTPIALDFGWPIKSERGDNRQVVSFSFDRPF